MNARSPLPAGFWLLLGTASLFASLLTWNGQRIDAKRQIAAARDAVAATTLAATVTAEPTAAPAEPVNEALAAPATENSTAPAVPRPPLVLPMESSSGTTVLRCTVRGRVIYIDTASVCPDGLPGKITVLPR